MKKYLLTLIVLIACQTAWSQCTADAGPEFILTCFTNEVTLQGSSNIPAATYSWSGPGGFTSNLQNPVVTEAGSYSLTITDPSDGCTATALTAVFLNTAPPVVTVTAGALTCAQPSFTIIVTVMPFNCGFQWTGPNNFLSNIQNPVVTTPGQYTVVVTNPSNGCTTVEQVIITQNVTLPDLSATGGTISCSNPNVTLTAASNTSGVTFAWSGPAGFFSSQQNPQVTELGNYTVTATAPNGCTSTAVAVVTQDGSFPQAIFDPIAPVCNNNGSIVISNPNPNYSYLWSIGDTGAIINNLGAGIYCVTVVDNANGCTNVACATIVQLEQALIGDTRTNPYCASKNGSITLTPIPSNAPLTFQWSGPNGFISTTPSISSLDSGTYIVTVTNTTSGCTSVNAFTLVRTYPPAFPGIWLSETICDDRLFIETNGIGNSFDWGAGMIIGNTNITELNLSPGSYNITISDGFGCSAAKTIIMPAASLPCTFVRGKVLLDENTNCIQDFAEPGLLGWYLKAENGNDTYYSLTDSEGNYLLRAIPGDYTLSLIPQGNQSFICQNDIPVSLAQTGDSTQVDFLVQLPDPDCANLSINLTTPVLRRCFSNNYYYLQYCNNGTAEATDVYFTLELDPLLQIQSAQIPFTNMGNNLYRFELGTLPPNFCEAAWVRVNVSCDATLGQIHCSEAHIYPDTLCGPTNPLWSGAQLEVKSECVGDSLHFIFKNIGAGNMTQVLDYIVIEDGIMGRQGSAAPLQTGQMMIVSVPANGATWRIEAAQEPFSPIPNQPWLSVEGCSNSGAFSTGFANQFPIGENSLWTDVDCTPNIGSYDPNDKQGFPIGYGPEHYIRPGTEIEYLIRFQNTGTDTAFNVVLRDTLSQWLDPLTVRAGASSHPYRFELAGRGTLIFDFQNIMLPDSNVNEAESHGFVRFSISPRTDVPLETDIPNTAAIYFDFNDPVITNTTVHRIGINFVSVGLWQPAQALYKVQVAPHPVQEASWITVTPAASRPGNYQLQVFDLLGRPVHRQESPEAQFLLRKTDLAAGVYLFKIENDGVLIGNGKLVVR